MDVLEFLVWAVVFGFGTSLLTGIAEILVSVSSEKPNPDKTRQHYFMVYFFILLVIACYFEGMRNKQLNRTLEEREEFVQGIIDDSLNLRDVEEAWDNREWDLE